MGTIAPFDRRFAANCMQALNPIARAKAAIDVVKFDFEQQPGNRICLGCIDFRLKLAHQRAAIVHLPAGSRKVFTDDSLASIA